MVRILAERAEEAADKAVAAMNTESLVRRAILDGVDPQEAYLRHRKF